MSSFLGQTGSTSMPHQNYNPTVPTSTAVALNGLRRAKTQVQQPQKGSEYTNNLKSDATFGAGIGGLIGAFNKPEGATFAARQLSRAKNIGANVAAGGLAAAPASLVNTATGKMSDNLANHYGKEDNKTSMLHAGIIAAPAVAGGVYGLGAIVHGMNSADKITKAKGWKAKGKLALNSMNPLEHAKAGVSETKKAFSDLLSLRKKGFKTRGLGLLNIAGLAATAAPALIKYFHTMKQKKQQQDNANMQSTLHKMGYTDDVFNALSAATAKKPMIKTAVYIPIVTNLMKGKETLNEIKHLTDIGQAGIDTSASIAKKMKKMKLANKHFRNAGYDALGLGVTGAGIYAYSKLKKDNPYSSLGRYV